MAGKKVFVSYDHSEDVHYKELLRAWNANTKFEFEFDQRSPNVAINSEDAGRVKASLTAKMKEADYLLVIVGKKSSVSKWIAWEIERAKQSDTKLKLGAVKIESSNVMPSGLLDVGTARCTGFTLAGIVGVLEKADNNYI
jgi:hypothetical protein